MALQFARPSGVPLHNRSVRRCRASLFVRRLAQIVDTSDTAYGLAKWWRCTHGHLDEHSEQMWASLLKGSLPRDELRRLMITEYPGLQEALINPLWLSLSKLSTDSADCGFWDSCAQAIELNGAPLPTFSNSVMKRLCASPNWNNLGFLLILLRSGSAKFVGYRSWLQRHFVLYFCIALLHRPIDRVAFRLFRCIDSLVKDGALAAGDWKEWPKDEQSFGETLHCCQLAFELTHYRAWCNNWHETDDVHSLFWLLCQDEVLCEEYFAAGKEEESDYEFGKRSPLPNRLRMRWRRTAERARATQISLAWSRCCQQGLTPSDQRVLRRLRLEADWKTPVGSLADRRK